MEKIITETELPIDIGQYKVGEQQKIYTACILLVLHRSGGEEHIASVIKKVNNLDFLKSIDNVDNNNIQFARMNLGHAGYINPPRKKEEEGFKRGLWVLADNSRVVDVIDRLVNAKNESEFIEALNYSIDKVNKDLRQYWKEKNREDKKRIQDEQEQEIKQEIQEEKEEQSEVLSNLKKLSPTNCERYCVQLLNKIGGEWETKTKKAEQKDGGIDLIGYVNIGIVKIQVVAQVKKYTDNNATEKEMRLFIGDKVVHNAQNGVFITTTDFNSKAQDLARINNITLINGEELVRLIDKYEMKDALENMLMKQNKG